jgi:hypothetical protein
MVKTGFKKGVTIGTPVAVGAGDGLYILSESLKPDIPRIPDVSLGGSRQMLGADISGERYAGSVVLPGRYEGAWVRLLAMLLGTAGTPSGAGPYVHTFKPANDPSGLFGTLVFDKQIGANVVWEYDSVWVNAVTIRSEAGTGDAARARFDVELIARKLNRGSATNGATQITALTFPTAGHLLHHNLKIRMNTNAGGALGAPDELKVRGLELTIRNHYKADFFITGQSVIDSPEIAQHLEVTGRFMIDKYSADSPGLTEFLAGTYMKADVVWTTGASAIVKAELPYLQLLTESGDRSAGGPGVIAAPIAFQAFKPPSAPTGMTATDALWLFLTNNFATDYLA